LSENDNIVGFREVGKVNEQFYIVMDYVAGTDAGRLLKTHGPMPIRRAVRLTCQMLDALDYAHAKGFIHRDIKPANLLVTQVGGREVAKLADFGLARVYQASRFSGLTMMENKGGTIAFVPPEQLLHLSEVRPESDLYSVGATLYNLLTERHVYDFPKTTERRMRTILEQDPVPIQSRGAPIPSALAEVIHRSLAREPQDRFASAAAMRRALTQAGW
jgi:serine/threonine-protein kinase